MKQHHCFFYHYKQLANMKFYWIKTHWIVRKIFSNYIWKIPNTEKKIYLTFDDGPTPEITNWALDILKTYQAKATFFCIGENIAKNPTLFQEILNQGHAVGNHTHKHLNGWHTADSDYLNNVEQCNKVIEKNKNQAPIFSKLFRPPYGKLTSKQVKLLKEQGYKIIMWDILSADFDTTITPKKCAENVLKNIQPGSIIIFHDSLKASKNLKVALPETLEYLKMKGYKMEAIKYIPEPN